MVEHPQHAAGQIQDSAEQDGHGGGTHAYQSQTHEYQGNDRGGKNLEETLNPEVDYPPSPVLADGKVGVLHRYQARRVEEGNSGHGKHKNA